MHMKYSREQRNFHVEKVLAFLAEDINLSARSVFRKLNRGGLRLSQGYVNQLMADALAKLADEDRRQRQGVYKHIELQGRLLEMGQELREMARKLESLAAEYPVDLKPRY